MFIKEGFQKMFNGKVYWPTFIINLFFFAIVGLFVAILGVSFIQSLIGIFMHQGANTNNANISVLLMKLLGSFVLLLVFALIMKYLSFVKTSFILTKLNNTKASFFSGFGKAFGYAFLLLIGEFVLMLSLFIISLIIIPFEFIPILGIILSVLLGIFMGLYSFITKYAMFAGINNKGFGFGFSQFIIVFRKPKLFLYAFVYILVLLLLVSVLGLLLFLFFMINKYVFFVVLVLYLLFILPLLEIFVLNFGVEAIK